MTNSPEWKSIAIAVTVAFVSISLLAVDAALDLNFNGLAKRLESAQASFVDTVGQYQLAFAVPARARDKSRAEEDCQEHRC